MNVVHLGVLAGQDVGLTIVLIVGLLSLLGAAILLLLALAPAVLRFGAARPKLVPVTLSRAVGQEMQPMHPGELIGAGRASRAPPHFPPRVQSESTAMLRAAPRFVRRR